MACHGDIYYRVGSVPSRVMLQNFPTIGCKVFFPVAVDETPRREGVSMPWSVQYAPAQGPNAHATIDQGMKAEIASPTNRTHCHARGRGSDGGGDWQGDWRGVHLFPRDLPSYLVDVQVG
jgi:hypothetical protein